MARSVAFRCRTVYPIDTIRLGRGNHRNLSVRRPKMPLSIYGSRAQGWLGCYHYIVWAESSWFGRLIGTLRALGAL